MTEVKFEENARKNLDLKVFKETEVVVFPLNEQKRPICFGIGFTLTQQDIPYEKNVTYHRINPMKITDKSRVCHMIRIVLNLSREYHINSENVVG